jgi:hypothetical protein
MEEKKEKLKQPSNQIQIKIGMKGMENEYTIKFPTNGQLIDIERRKQSLTLGTGKDMLASNSATAYQAFILTEAIATFSVLTTIEKDLNTNIMDLTPLQSKSLVKAYEKYYEWMQGWMEYINQDDEDEKKSDE